MAAKKKKPGKKKAGPKGKGPGRKGPGGGPPLHVCNTNSICDWLTNAHANANHGKGFVAFAPPLGYDSTQQPVATDPYLQQLQWTVEQLCKAMANVETQTIVVFAPGTKPPAGPALFAAAGGGQNPPPPPPSYPPN